ncbi:MAG: hypothetical protein KGL39_32480, partial [Patescibacteria group bacterium]|nr:hypothetical protein [Patescibacteria group bacterium]
GYFRPILAENGGWAIFNFTPRGKNHAYALWNLAKANPKEWWTQRLTVRDTNAISAAVLERERREMFELYKSDALYLQEYECAFDVPVSGAYYSEHMAEAQREGRICKVTHDPSLAVDTIWDLGVNDRTAIWFAQYVGTEVRLIDYLEGANRGMVDYIKDLKKKPYVYGTHIAPHDIKVREFSTGKSRLETAEKLGIEFDVAPKLSRADGIDAVRNVLSRCWFDEEKCANGISALQSYHKKWDDRRKTYLNEPEHDWSSNGADSFRMLAVWLQPDYHGQRVNRHGETTDDAPDKYERTRRTLVRGTGDMPDVAVLG